MMQTKFTFRGGDRIIPFDDTAVRPYGDSYNDGMMQISFTLPLEAGARATEAARRILLNMGFESPEIAFERGIGEAFTYFIAYAKSPASVNCDEIKISETKKAPLSRIEIDRIIQQRFRRKLTVIGACTGFDAHTVGIDAILSMKGVDHHHGLERYRMFRVFNMGSQISNEELLDRAREVKADAILISQLVTQKESHIKNLTRFIELAEAAGMRKSMILIIGGPRITNELALELGFDAGFGRRTYPEEVAAFIADRLWERMSAGG